MKMIHLVLPFVLLTVLSESRDKDEVPYKSVLESLVNCSTSLPKNPPATAVLERYERNGKTFFRGSISINNATGGLRFHITYFVHNLDKRQKVASIRNINCYSQFVNFVIKSIVRIPMNEKRCTLKVGTYNFSNVDVDAIDHKFRTHRIYGKSIMRIEGATSHMHLGCYEFNIKTLPLDL